MKNNIYIDPSYSSFNADGLFNLSDTALNRDDQLKPFFRLREFLNSSGINVQTADFLVSDSSKNEKNSDYISLGILENYESIFINKKARLAAFVIMEPPVVAPHLYAELPKLTKLFDRVYIHNIHGDGYSLEGVDKNKLHKMFYPVPYNDVIPKYWDNKKRMKRIVVINGSHNPHSRGREQYSLRIKAMSELAKAGVVDLYGVGWNRWWSRSAFWLPYWTNFRSLMSIYKGKCDSKFEVLQKYEFCLCFENMSMDGYITEKMFDCLYAGTIPLYVGPPDIFKYIPEDVFVDCRKYSSWKEMWEDVSSMSPEEIETMKFAGCNFLKSNAARKFYDAINSVCVGN
jgi:alpha(1,3/1,4) fucosyltransferase